MREEFLVSILTNIEAIALRYFRSDMLATQNKQIEDFDPVTKGDQEIEQFFREAVAKLFPDDAVIGEEFDNMDGRSGYRWTIDPIDGTRAFLIGAPSFTTLIALEGPSGFELAVISQPFTGERFWRTQKGAFWQRGDQKSPLHTSGKDRISDAFLASTFPEIGTILEKQAFERVSREAKLTRYGLDGYAYGLLAMGQLDLVIEAGLKPFDYLAPQAVIESAGGVFINWEGHRPSGEDRIIAAANAKLADVALKLING